MKREKMVHGFHGLAQISADCLSAILSLIRVNPCNLWTNLILLISLLFVSCPDPLPRHTELGSFTLNVTDSRTIMPKTPSFYTFAVYQVDFKVAGIIVTTDDITNQSDVIYLLPGTYDVEVTAYADNAKSKPAASGTALGVVINAGANTSPVVTLTVFGTSEGTGTFKWDILFNSDLTLNTAQMAVGQINSGIFTPSKDEDGNEIIINLLDEPDGEMELAYGYHQVKFTLIKSDAEQSLIWFEPLHIYQNLTSHYAPEQFTNDSFNKKRYVVTLNYNYDNQITFTSIEHGNDFLEPDVPPRTGFIFDAWYMDSGLTVPAEFPIKDVTKIVSLFAKWIPTYTVTVINGTGGSSFESGASVTITANEPSTGYQFKEWTTTSEGVTFNDAADQTTTFIMPSNNVTVTATYEVIPVYNISLSESGTYTFTTEPEGYTTAPSLTVTVTNTGNQATGALTVALSGTNPNNFTLSTTSISSIAVDGTATFTVSPGSLTANTYIATVTVSGSNSISASFGVSFTVVATVTTFSVSTVAELKNKIDEINNGSGKFYEIEIDDDITGSDFDFNGNNTIIINGNGKTMTHDGLEHELFVIRNGADVTINNLQMQGVDSVYNKALIYIGGSTLTMNGGLITGHNIIGTYARGAGVYIESGGTFIMNDGEIYNNSTTNSASSADRCGGGGVSILGGTFIMNGGSIYNNRVISSNGYGGGVCVNNDGIFIMTDGRIAGTGDAYSNTATNGNAVWVNSVATFKINGISQATGSHNDTIEVP